ncbi:GTP-binding protein lepA [Mesomycoplasma dispar]|uniref:GTP-binding protein lepA n=1 Tax=Mesomycoplasma dispar TaxID=86660 RepID=A0AAJ5TCQ9_9BACT|nr:hypothetical protein [Mesomycoplasma dispar]AJR12043.1 hypothetical protein MDIS_00950 [Mesomycoplasma dispar]VEU61383.1 GTP-binding protein lepA [Mesomycoplasma dispar]
MKIKSILTKFLVTNSLISPLFLIACSEPVSTLNKTVEPKKSYEFTFNKQYDANYFLNLLNKNNDEFNTKTATFSGLNFFYNQDEKDLDKNFFLGDYFSNTIQTFDQFQKIIVNKTLKLIKNVEHLPNHLKIPESEIIREFQNKFLDSRPIKEVLEKNNIFLIEITRQWKYDSAYNYYLEKDKNSDTLNVINLMPSYVEEITHAPDELFPRRPYFISIVYPKSTKLNFKDIVDYIPSTKDKLKRSIENTRIIYKKLEQKYKFPKTEINTFSNYFMLDVIDFSQNTNKIKTLKPKILDLVSKKINPWNNSFFPEKQVIIKNNQEFKDKILDRVLELNPKTEINKVELTTDFETKFLDGKKLDEVLKNYNIFIYETWEQLKYQHRGHNWYDLEDEKLILRKKENNKIFLTTILKTDLILNFPAKFDLPFDKVAFQVLLVPKDKNVVFEKKVDRFELIKDLKQNYLQEYKQKNLEN